MRWNLALGLACCAALAVAAVLAPAAHAQKLAGPGVSGARLFHDHCSVCHGDAGDGHSRAAADLQPRPRDFTAPQAAVELGRERMIHSVREGRPGTAMAPWKGRLTDAQIATVVDFIRERFMVPVAYDTTDDGRRIYAQYCSVCHGDRGNGVSRAAHSLDPPPRNFTTDRARSELSRDRMIFSVTYGRANTAMAAWGSQLKPRQVLAVVDYVRTAFMHQEPGADPAVAAAHGEHEEHGAHRGPEEHGAQGGPGMHAHTPPGGKAANFRLGFPHGLKGHAAAGQRLYQTNCVPCHGAKGDGKGPRAFFILPKPRDFSLPASRASLNRPHLFEGISKGIVGSEMPAWETVLSPQQIADIGEYVLGAFIRPGRDRKP